MSLRVPQKWEESGFFELSSWWSRLPTAGLRGQGEGSDASLPAAVLWLCVPGMAWPVGSRGAFWKPSVLGWVVVGGLQCRWICRSPWWCFTPSRPRMLRRVVRGWGQAFSRFPVNHRAYVSCREAVQSSPERPQCGL